MRYLFQGDSITDAGRANYEDPHSMGSGYPRLLEADLTFGQDCEVMNCGVSGKYCGSIGKMEEGLPEPEARRADHFHRGQ